jgi:hypothetical protein
VVAFDGTCRAHTPKSSQSPQGRRGVLLTTLAPIVAW